MDPSAGGQDGLRQRRRPNGEANGDGEVENDDMDDARRQAGERVDRGNRADRGDGKNFLGRPKSRRLTSLKLDEYAHLRHALRHGLLGGVMGKCGVLLAMLLAFFALDVLQLIIFGDDDRTSTEPLMTYWSSGNGDGGRVDHVEDATSRVELSWQASKGPAVELRFRAAMDALNTGHLKESYDKFYALYQSSGNLTALAYAGQTQFPLNSTRGAELLELAANQGEPHAQFMLGLYYSNNRGDPNRITNPGEHEKDYGKGILYLYASSTAGHTGAMMTMGYRHLFGYGVPRNCETAAMNYIEIAQRIAHIYSTGLPQAVELVRLNLQGVLAGETGTKKGLSPNEISLFKQLAYGGDVNIASAVGKRYLLGVEGFQQSYSEAKKFLELGASQSHDQSQALLGYMYCLGLGVEADVGRARAFFSAAADQGDALGLNGLGYLNFEAREYDDAFSNFNKSAIKGSADGMFNLASLYLTGTGTVQSFPTAFMWYAQALERGHTPAAYALAIMHLNGVGTVRDCQMAVKLLKEVAERGDWVTDTLDAAYAQKAVDSRASALSFLQLAEAGHEVSQSNLAHLLDRDHIKLFPSDASEKYDSADQDGHGVFSPKTESLSLIRLLSPLEIPNASGRVLAQRFYEMSADQGSPSSELRLGDFAYYGWGIGVELADTMKESEMLTEWRDDEREVTKRLQTAEIRYYKQDSPDYASALSHYKRTADTQVIAEWMQPFIGQARFDVGFMYQWGLGGVPMDLSLAAKHYEKCLEVHPSSGGTVVSIMRVVLKLQEWYMSLPARGELTISLIADRRLRLIAICGVALTLLVLIRGKFAMRAEEEDLQRRLVVDDPQPDAAAVAPPAE